MFAISRQWWSRVLHFSHQELVKSFTIEDLETFANRLHSRAKAREEAVQRMVSSSQSPLKRRRDEPPCPEEKENIKRSSVSKVDLPVKTSDDTCQAVKSRPATNHSGTVSVAARAAVFENAIVQSHGTLPPLRTVPTRPPLRQAFPMVGGASSTDGKLSMIPKIASTLSVVPDAAKMPSKPDAESREGAPSKTNVENNCRSSFASASKSAQLPENAFQKAMNVMGNSVELTLLAQVPVLHQHTTKKAGGIGDDISSSSPDAVLQEKLAGDRKSVV